VIDPKTNRIVRGLILRGVASQSDRLADWMLLPALQGVGHALSEAELRGHLKYLEAKGYLATEAMEEAATVGHPGALLVSVTPLGIDLLEGTIKDGGVTIPPWAR